MPSTKELSSYKSSHWKEQNVQNIDCEAFLAWGQNSSQSLELLSPFTPLCPASSLSLTLPSCPSPLTLYHFLFLHCLPTLSPPSLHHFSSLSHLSPPSFRILPSSPAPPSPLTPLFSHIPPSSLTHPSSPLYNLPPLHLSPHP